MLRCCLKVLLNRVCVCFCSDVLKCVNVVLGMV